MSNLINRLETNIDIRYFFSYQRVKVKNIYNIKYMLTETNFKRKYKNELYFCKESWQHT